MQLLKTCFLFKVRLGGSQNLMVLMNWAPYYLKGQCHEIFDPRFFSSNNPP
jgi:hypothetical protein